MVEDLRVARKPKSKFAFKRTAVSGPDTSQGPSIVAGQASDKELPQELLRSSNKTNHASLSDYSYSYITIADLVTSNNPSDLTISNIDHCIINLASSQGHGDDVIQLSAVHVEQLSDSVLILPMVNGSILLHGLTRCVLAVGCHQVGRTEQPFWHCSFFATVPHARFPERTRIPVDYIGPSY